MTAIEPTDLNLVPCPACDGAGWVPLRGKTLACVLCHGEGDVSMAVYLGYRAGLARGRVAGDGIAEGLASGEGSARQRYHELEGG